MLGNKNQKTSYVILVLPTSGSSREWVTNVFFLSVLKQRLLEKYNHEWLNAVNSSSRFSFYGTFKSSLLPEQYFDCVTPKFYRDALIKIRLRCSTNQ